MHFLVLKNQCPRSLNQFRIMQPLGCLTGDCTAGLNKVSRIIKDYLRILHLHLTSTGRVGCRLTSSFWKVSALLKSLKAHSVPLNQLIMLSDQISRQDYAKSFLIARKYGGPSCSSRETVKRILVQMYGYISACMHYSDPVGLVEEPL